jgi:hypothetical protein
MLYWSYIASIRDLYNEVLGPYIYGLLPQSFYKDWYVRQTLSRYPLDHSLALVVIKTV